MKNNKVTTLIELLVVVAIIGILAAVGVAYTVILLQNASKTLYSQSVKYLTAEIQKCILNPSGTAIEGNITCNANTTPTQWAEAFETKSTDRIYNSSEAAVSVAAASTTEGTLYVTAVEADDTADPPVEASLALYCFSRWRKCVITSCYFRVKFFMTKAPGFTLIELLVVVTIHWNFIGGWNSCLFRLRSRYTTKICRKHVNDNWFSTNRRDV